MLYILVANSDYKSVSSQIWKFEKIAAASSTYDLKTYAGKKMEFFQTFKFSDLQIISTFSYKDVYHIFGKPWSAN